MNGNVSFTPEFKCNNSDEFKEFDNDDDSKNDPDYDEYYHNLIYTRI